jgi:thiamine-triphosphatase
LYEIEQKFAFNPALLARFRSNNGQPPFRHLARQRVESFQDEYFDSANLLSKSGVWIRRRNNSWEAKHRQSGDFLRSSFYETDKVDEITKLISMYAHTVSPAAPSDNFGLKRICRYLTRRETFLADHRFSIMLDSTDFGHWVGEVELQTQHAATALSDIDTFMQQYSWFFVSKATPKGKMTAYFERFGFPSDVGTAYLRCVILLMIEGCSLNLQAAESAAP